jgi:glycine/D-amino acid oxidase-like deaminating enzyme
LVPRIADLPIKANQACFLPYSSTSRPIIGKVPQFDNVFVATGHGVWGILLASITGLLLSELVLKGVDGSSKKFDLTPFYP